MSFPRVVMGYHGCLEPLASDLLTGRRSIADWPVSRNKWDWLGEGIYFWEHGPARAMKWAEDRAAKARAKGAKDATPAVIGAVIALGGDDVLDLTDVRFAPALKGAFTILRETYAKTGRKLPVNEATDRKRHYLDCLIINSLFVLPEVRQRFNVVRGAFEEGLPVFPGSTIKEQTHIQLAVRNPSAIRGIFRPVL
jgi:hypothetical protein